MKPLQTQLFFGRQAAVNAVQAAIEPADKFRAVGVQSVILRLFQGNYAQELVWIENIPEDVRTGKTNQVAVPKAFTDAVESWANDADGKQARFFRTGNGTVAYRNSAVGVMTITTETIAVPNPYFKAAEAKPAEVPKKEEKAKEPKGK